MAHRRVFDPFISELIIIHIRKIKKSGGVPSRYPFSPLGILQLKLTAQILRGVKVPQKEKEVGTMSDIHSDSTVCSYIAKDAEILKF